MTPLPLVPEVALFLFGQDDEEARNEVHPTACLDSHWRKLV